ncbi:carboxypeptidase regulatory-like domain-containing protein [Archangium violaceum]|uniref:carboxypeptidase regulatory-like domain-containing protein n=1 Tax=Archangium violaceum TaxID=83451 RepID=UPI0019502EF2|nr:carboxypeptidase regulatory-like domain-containing protein [Archangium violaceum]QRO00923.1 carboxypeptidase regulatory-like domain-containing protein [Archangium violaceum]
MRQTVYYSVMMTLAVAVGACGGFDNTPFRTGTVRGRLTEADPSVALVSLVGDPALRGTVAEDGSFVLKNVPAGPVELFILASADKAVRLPVQVPGGGSAHLEEVVPREAGFLALRVKAPSHQRVSDGQVSVMGMPFQGLRLDEDGCLRLGPLPDGCYDLEVSVPGYPVKKTNACVKESEQKELKVQLSEPDDDLIKQGCTVTGCERGTHCASDGRCVECTADDQCTPGFSCRSERCEGPGVLCAACNGDWQCMSSVRCETLPRGLMACVARCDGKTECPQGFTCQGTWCLPQQAQLASCFAYRQVGASCDGDERCRARGIVQGLCVEESCTFRCTSDTECPEGFACTETAVGAVCRPRR